MPSVRTLRTGYDGTSAIGQSTRIAFFGGTAGV